jgi:hypothetical protein
MITDLTMHIGAVSLGPLPCIIELFISLVLKPGSDPGRAKLHIALPLKHRPLLALLIHGQCNLYCSGGAHRDGTGQVAVFVSNMGLNMRIVSPFFSPQAHAFALRSRQQPGQCSAHRCYESVQQMQQQAAPCPALASAATDAVVRLYLPLLRGAWQQL